MKKACLNKRLRLHLSIEILWILVVIAFLLFGCTQTQSEKPLEGKIDRIRVIKHDRVLILFKKNKPVRTYRIALGRNPVGKKRREGDGKTPEGKYVIDWKNPKSKYHLSLHISYPNKVDKAYAQKHGFSPGGDIFIHGLPNGRGAIGKLHRLYDWTDGCIAVTNEEVEELWKVVPVGTPIEILP